MSECKGRGFVFSLFAKKTMSEEAAKAFWMWFEESEEWIVRCIAQHDSDFVFKMDERLKRVFPYFRGELEFQLGFDGGAGEFFFFHQGKRELARDGETLGRLMPAALAARWQFILQK